MDVSYKHAILGHSFALNQKLLAISVPALWCYLEGQECEEVLEVCMRSVRMLMNQFGEGLADGKWGQLVPREDPGPLWSSFPPQDMGT